jgi:hypothetical protein
MEPGNNLEVNDLSTERGKRKISMLSNSIYYFLECVFIMTQNDHFRLIVIHNRRLLTDRSYKSERSARIAFSKIYGQKGWEKNLKPIWTQFYRPDGKWLKEKSEIREEK